MRRIVIAQLFYHVDTVNDGKFSYFSSLQNLLKAFPYAVVSSHEYGKAIRYDTYHQKGKRKMKVAVYGTLKRKERANHLLSGAGYLGPDVLGGWEMGSNGSYPFIFKGDKNIAVEVYEISEAMLDSLDAYEGYPSLYSRLQIQTTYGEAWIYYQDKPNTSTGIEAGLVTSWKGDVK